MLASVGCNQAEKSDSSMLVVEGQLYLSLLILLKLMDSQNNEAAKELADHLVAKIGKQGQERVSEKICFRFKFR